VFKSSSPEVVGAMVLELNFGGMKMAFLIVLFCSMKHQVNGQTNDSCSRIISFSDWANQLMQSDFPEPDAVEGSVLLDNGQWLFWKKQVSEKNGSVLGVKLEVYLYNRESGNKSSIER
jgi:hypothetical protein